MLKKALFVTIEIYEESTEEITLLEKKLIDLKVSHRVTFKEYGIVEVTLELPYKTTIARGHERLIISLNMSTNDNIKIHTNSIYSINIEVGNTLKENI